MNGVEIWLGIFLLLLSLVFTTVNLTLRRPHRVRLSQQLERRGRENLADTLASKREELMVATATVRTLANIGIAFVVMSAVLPDQHHPGLGVFLLSFGIAAGLVFLFGVGLPHAWAEYSGEAVVAALAPVLLVCAAIFRPVVAAKNSFDGLLRGLTGEPGDDESVNEIEREILETVSEGEAQGKMAEEEKEMIESVIELRNLRVAEIMTPRIEIVGVEISAGFEDVRRVIAEHGHSRVPIYEESLDNIVGILYARDLLLVKDPGEFQIRKIMRKALFVPETKTVSDLLREFRSQRTQIAVVLDEYGGTAGLVTVEDIFEEMVGELGEGHEPVEPEPIVRLSDDTAEIDARVRVDEINEELGLHLPEDEGYDTVGGFVMSRLGRIPKSGDELRFNNLHIKVLEAGERRVKRLRITVHREENGRGNGSNGKT